MVLEFLHIFYYNVGKIKNQYLFDFNRMHSFKTGGTHG